MKIKLNRNQNLPLLYEPDKQADQLLNRASGEGLFISEK